MAAPRGPQFSQVLEHAHQEPPPRAPAPSRAASQDTQARAVSRRRGAGPDAATGRQAPEADQADAQPAPSGTEPRPAETPRNPKGTEAGTVEADRAEKRRDEADAAVVQPDPATVRMPAPPAPQNAAQIAGAQLREGEVLAMVPTAPTLATGYAASGLNGSTIQAQLGLAAYRLSPHGTAEPALPTAAAPAHVTTALQPADPNQQPMETDLHVVNVFEMVQLSNAAHAALAAGEEGAAGAHGAAEGAAAGAVAPQNGARPLHADPKSAQARNQLLSEIGGPARAGQPHGVAQPQAAAAAPAQAEAALPGTAARGEGDTKAVKLESTSGPAHTAPAMDAPPPQPSAAAIGTAHQARDTQPAADTAPQANANLIDRIAEQSRWLIRSGHSEVTLKLQPEHLGEMRLKVVHKDGDLTVQMTVDSAATKHLVDASLNDLRQRLQSENLAQGNLLLNVDIQHGSDTGRFAHLAQQAAQDGRAQGVNVHPAEQAAPAAAPRPSGWGSSNINIYA
jgi:flagellar hook-length control protein FliK